MATILLVEDDRQLRWLMERVLTKKGYLVKSAAGGDEALELSAGDLAGVDLLVTDVVMPGLTGPAVAQALRKRRPGLRALFVSGYAQDAIQEQGLLDVSGSFLQKPYTPDMLIERVERLLADDLAA
jgi:CheY-like chemotaxis protein